MAVGKKRHGRPYLGRRGPSAWWEAVRATHAAITPQTFGQTAGAIFPLPIQYTHEFILFSTILVFSSYPYATLSGRGRRTSVCHASATHTPPLVGTTSILPSQAHPPIILRQPSEALRIVAVHQHARSVSTSADHLPNNLRRVISHVIPALSPRSPLSFPLVSPVHALPPRRRNDRTPPRCRSRLRRRARWPWQQRRCIAVAVRAAARRS